MTDLPAKPFTDDILRRIAMEIGKEVVAHIEHAYPEMFDAVSASAKLSVRNATYNAVMMHVRAADCGETDKLIKDMEEHRRKMRALRKARPLVTP